MVNNYAITSHIIQSGTPAPPPQKPLVVTYNPPNPLANLKGVDAYIKYDNLILNDGTNIQDLTNNPIDCITKCVNNPNCQGLNIIKNVNPEEITTNGYNYQTIPKATCEYISNINYSNSKTENINAKFYAKINNLAFENNVPYLLDIGNKCLSLQKKPDGSMAFNAVSCNDYDKLTPVYFNTASDTIKVGTDGNNCLKYSTDGTPQLVKCNDYDNSQKFIYDYVYKSLRPFNDTTKCLWKNGDENLVFFDSGVIVNDPTLSHVTTFQNYYKPDKDDNIEYFEKDYTVDMTYYIIYMILLCLIFYLVIIISSKNNK
jgi:hypothetical protein